LYVSVNLTVKMIGVPATAVVAETVGLSNVLAPSAEPADRAISSSAGGIAARTRIDSPRLRRTVTSFIRRRMGRQGGPGNGTAVLYPRTCAPSSAAGSRPESAVRPIAREHSSTGRHLIAHPQASLRRWAHGDRGPFGRCRHTTGDRGGVRGHPVTGPTPGHAVRTSSTVRPGTYGPDRAHIGPTAAHAGSRKLVSM
jgi:hypothetical protein